MKKIIYLLKVSLATIVAVVVLNRCKKEVTENPKAIPITPRTCPLTVSDIDGNIYNVKKIGNQCWITENLKTTHYNNGDSIYTTIPDTLDFSNETEPKYKWAYKGNESNVSTYGRLYTWYVVTDSRGICPKGWHIPSKEEFDTLVTYLGGADFAGSKLKEAGTTHWNTYYNISSDNSSGFNALPSGQRSELNSLPQYYNKFWGIGQRTKFWSNTPCLPGSNAGPAAWYLYLSYDSNRADIEYFHGQKYTANPVRITMD